MHNHTTADTVQLITSDRRNLNLLVDLIDQLQVGDDEARRDAVNACLQVFTYFMKDKGWKKDSPKTTTSSEAPLNLERQVYEWIIEKYKHFVDYLLNSIGIGDDSESFEVSTLMSLLVSEYTNKMKTLKKKAKGDEVMNLKFPNQLFIKIIKRLITIEKPNSKVLISFVKDYLQFEDVKFYTLKNIDKLLEAQKIHEQESLVRLQSMIAENVYTMLKSILPVEAVAQEALLLNQANVDNLKLNTDLITKRYRAVFSAAWFSLLRLPALPEQLIRRILLDIDVKIVPHLIDPKLLIDFLTDCYDRGGATSLLALSGLFTLIQGYNLDYPHFYKKLYSLFQPSLFHVRYKSRFYHLTDMFLSSTHLPAYLVASFAKRMARLALFAPVADIIILLILIRNLMLRHPSSRVLIHRNQVALSLNAATEDEQACRDPFVEEEEDPSKCEALRSSLWEFTTIKRHYHPVVIKLVDSFAREFKQKEASNFILSEYLDADYEAIITEHLEQERKEGEMVATNFERPATIFGDDYEMWNLC